MRIQAKWIEAGAIKLSMWHTASAAFDVAGPEGSTGLDDCGESPGLACAMSVRQNGRGAGRQNE